MRAGAAPHAIKSAGEAIHLGSGLNNGQEPRFEGKSPHGRRNAKIVSGDTVERCDAPGGDFRRNPPGRADCARPVRRSPSPMRPTSSSGLLLPDRAKSAASRPCRLLSTDPRSPRRLSAARDDGQGGSRGRGLLARKSSGSAHPLRVCKAPPCYSGAWPEP